MKAPCNIKLIQKNRLQQIGLQFPEESFLKIKLLKIKNKRKIKICGNKKSFVFSMTQFIQILYFLKFNLIFIKRKYETKYLKMWQNIYAAIFSNFLLDVNFHYKLYMRIYGIAYKAF